MLAVGSIGPICTSMVLLLSNRVLNLRKDHISSPFPLKIIIEVKTDGLVACMGYLLLVFLQLIIRFGIDGIIEFYPLDLDYL